MSRSLKTKRNKVPKIGDKEYAEYINFLKISDGEVMDVGVNDFQLTTENGVKKSGGLKLGDCEKKD